MTSTRSKSVLAQFGGQVQPSIVCSSIRTVKVQQFKQKLVQIRLLVLMIVSGAAGLLMNVVIVPPV